MDGRHHISTTRIIDPLLRGVWTSGTHQFALSARETRLSSSGQRWCWWCEDKQKRRTWFLRRAERAALAVGALGICWRNVTSGMAVDVGDGCEGWGGRWLGGVF